MLNNKSTASAGITTNTTVIINAAIAFVLIGISLAYIESYITTNAEVFTKLGYILIAIFTGIGALWMGFKSYIIHKKSYNNNDKLTDSSGFATSAQKIFIAQGMRSLGEYWESPKF